MFVSLLGIYLRKYSLLTFFGSETVPALLKPLAKPAIFARHSESINKFTNGWWVYTYTQMLIVIHQTRDSPHLAIFLWGKIIHEEYEIFLFAFEFIRDYRCKQRSFAPLNMLWIFHMRFGYVNDLLTIT